MELESRLTPGQLTGPQLLDGGVPAYASLPGAEHTIYLDYDGHTTSGTSWNGAKYGSAIVTPPYSLDGNPAVFSIAESEAIREMFLRVSEDFLPFAVNVTTIEPPLSALVGHGVRVCIGGSYQDWYGFAFAGVTLGHSFTYPSDTPAFVFANTLSNDTKWIAENISHEVGHSLGLNHSGVPGSPYYQGHNDWAPIMGASYFRDVSQWDRGEYPGAMNKQDDLEWITTINGFGYRADDYTAPVFLGVDVTVSGIIERNTDVDVFAFKATRKQYTFEIQPAAVGPNLDIKATVHDSTGGTVYVSAPLDRLDASFTIRLKPGEYTLSIEGDGGPGYSDYGSLGRYSVTWRV